MGNEVLFIGTERGIEARILAGGKFPLRTIQAQPLKGRSLLGKMKAIWSIPSAVSEAMSILKDFRPQIVLGVGGYASGPTLVAAFLLRMKRAIHEQNLVPGMTNRLLRRFSQRIFISFDETKSYFPGDKTFVTGNPIRREIDRGGERKRGDRFTLFIFGGSAGAHRINEAMVGALDSLEGMKASLKFIHQTGKADVDFVSKAYQEKGFEALVRPFFEDMVACYQASDLVISRSGASTIAELAVCGKAVIFVPYPYAAHNHQFLNAQRLVDMGAARMIEDEELDGASLAQTILHLYAHPDERNRMEEAMGRVARPRAAQEIVDHCYALVGN
jgi:UDP-N-acetylglucosamine--N-acetylmuramyl-(pentapeptide) pyrophosphoryl-undecaprenol N-acetylglucosamine transferase